MFITITLGSYISIFHLVSINIVGMNIVSGLRRLTRLGTCKDEDSVSTVQSSNYSTPHHTPHRLKLLTLHHFIHTSQHTPGQTIFYTIIDTQPSETTLKYSIS